MTLLKKKLLIFVQKRAVTGIDDKIKKGFVVLAYLVNTGHAQPVLPDLYPSAGTSTVTAGGQTLSGLGNDRHSDRQCDIRYQRRTVTLRLP